MSLVVALVKKPPLLFGGQCRLTTGRPASWLASHRPAAAGDRKNFARRAATAGGPRRLLGLLGPPAVAALKGRLNRAKFFPSPAASRPYGPGAPWAPRPADSCPKFKVSLYEWEHKNKTVGHVYMLQQKVVGESFLSFKGSKETRPTLILP